MFSVNAVAPILLLLALGFILSRIGFLPRSFLNKGNTLVFRLLLPMTIFHNIYTVEDIRGFNWSLILFSLVVIFLLCALGWLVASFLIQPRESKGVFIQCTFRSNFAIIGLPLAEALGGASSAAMAAVLSAFTIPLFNVLAVIVLSVYSNERKAHSFRKILYDVLTNPLIIAAAVGLFVLFVRSMLPFDSSGEPVFLIARDLPFLWKGIVWLHQTSGPLALLIMGGLLDFNAVKSKISNIIYGTLFRIVFAPVIGLFAAYWFNQQGWIDCGAGEFGALIALFGSPVAVSSAIMAAEMGGDDELARQYVVWTAIGSMVSLFMISGFLRWLTII